MVFVEVTDAAARNTAYGKGRECAQWRLKGNISLNLKSSDAIQSVDEAQSTRRASQPHSNQKQAQVANTATAEAATNSSREANRAEVEYRRRQY